MSQSTSQPTNILVWDLFVRFFHWGLVGAVSLAGLTGFILGATWLQIHLWAGTVAVALIGARIIWGALGPRYARFAQFIVSPGATLRHVFELRKGRAARHIGHNPLGGWMVLALIAAILGLGLSGVVVLGGVFKIGPLGFAISYDIGNRVNGLHKLLGYGLLVLIALHLAGVLFESLRSSENLVRSMWSGHKAVRNGDHVAPVAGARLAPRRSLAISLGIMLLGGSAFGLTALAQLPAPNMPVRVFDATYSDECGACHMAYPPSLMRAKHWRQLMATLPDHFGEDASLDTKTTAALTRWLVANAAETVDTKPSHVLRQTAANAPFTLTATPFWKRQHARIDKRVFTRPPVYASGNCAACHTDAASGAFYPANTAIPKEKIK